MKDKNSKNMSTTSLIAQAHSRKSGSSQGVTHDHGVMTTTTVEHDGEVALVENVHIFASGSKQGAFFSQDVR